MGGSPVVVGETRMLGLPLASVQGLWEHRHDVGAIAALNRSDAIRISSAVMVKGSIALRGACSAAASCSWPLVARKFYLSRAECKVAFAAPLAVADYKFGFKMKVTQVRWARAVLLGRPAGLTMRSVSGSLAAGLLADLGWTSLWASMAASAVSMYNAMVNDLPGFAHTMAARDPDPSPGSWVDAVRRLMRRYGVPMWQVDSNVRPGTATWKQQLRHYRRSIVLRALTQHQSSGLTQGALPWGWIAAHGGRSFTKRSFSAWWHLKTFGTLEHYVRKGSRCEYCTLCSGTTSKLRFHLESECPVFQLRSQVEGWNASRSFAQPSAPEEFQHVLAAIDSLIDELIPEEIFH